MAPAHSLLSKQDEHEHRVLEIWKSFRDAHGTDCAYHLSHAGYYLALRSSQQLSDVDGAALLDRLEEAKAHALTDLPEGATREDILRGMAAYADTIQIWSEEPAARREWGDALQDVQAKARIFRNLTHNLDLEQGIAQRVAKRRAVIVENLRLVGLTFLPGNEGEDPAVTGKKGAPR